MNALGGADGKVNGRRKQAREEVDKVSDKDQVPQKKSRFIWTRSVHNCFLDAIKQLGFHKAVPTKILELMNVENLTRENVASHLQKYRLQIKRRDQERAQVLAASENVPKAGYPHMSVIPQQPCNLPNTMQGKNMDCARLDGSQLAPSFTNHNLIRAFPTVQEAYGTPFKDSFDEGVNGMSSVRLMHGLCDSNGPHDINKIGYNYGPLHPKPLVDSYAHNLMDRHDTTLVPQYDRHDALFLQGNISPSFVSRYDQGDESSLQGIISPSFVSQYDQGDESSLQGIISPSFVPQYDRLNELFIADRGMISPLLAQSMEGLGVGVSRPPEAIGGLLGMKVEGTGIGMPRPPTGVLGMKIEGLGLGVPHLPEATQIQVERHGVGVPHLTTGDLTGMKVEGLGLGMPRLPEAPGGLAGIKVKGHVPRLPEATGGLTGMKVKGHGLSVPCLPEAMGGLARMKVEGHLPCLPEATGGLAGMKVEGHVPRLPEATGSLAGMKVEGHVPRLPEATGGLTGMKVKGHVVPRLPEATGGLTRMKVKGHGLSVPCLPEATGGLAGMTVEGHVPRLLEATGGLTGKNVQGHGACEPEAIGGLPGMKVEGLGAGVTHVPEATGGPGLGVPLLPEASGGLAGMNDFQQVFSWDEDLESALDFSEFWMNTKGDVDGSMTCSRDSNCYLY